MAAVEGTVAGGRCLPWKRLSRRAAGCAAAAARRTCAAATGILKGTLAWLTQPATGRKRKRVPFDPGEGRRDSLESCGSSGKSSPPRGRPKREGKNEKIAREKGLDVFISVADIINIPMDEFNEKMEVFKKDGIVEAGGQLLMTEDQAGLAREIRRRGKNKNYQDCRKRANRE